MRDERCHSDVNEDRAVRDQRENRPGCHDRERFTTPCGSEPFGIMEIASPSPKFHDHEGSGTGSGTRSSGSWKSTPKQRVGHDHEGF
jgi:hypothetical protein